MPGYTYGQLEQLWIDAGGSKAVAPLMAAIALAESGGNPGANNYTDNNGTQTSWGLWQVSNGTHSWPGALDPNIPINNAKYAVAKYDTQGLTAWGTYDSGAYRQYYQGSAPPSPLPPGSGGRGGGGQPGTSPSSTPNVATTAEFTSYWGDVGGAITHPWELFSQAIGDVWKGVTTVTDAPLTVTNSLGQLAKGFTQIVGLFDRLLHAVEWLFVPGNWVRIISFGGGVLFLLPGGYALMRAGQGSGDISLALGIFLIMISGVLFFVAFHNLPADVTNLQTLLHWLSTGVRTGHAATTASGG
jgi:hypothetical protein